MTASFNLTVIIFQDHYVPLMDTHHLFIFVVKNLGKVSCKF